MSGHLGELQVILDQHLNVGEITTRGLANWVRREDPDPEWVEVMGSVKVGRDAWGLEAPALRTWLLAAAEGLIAELEGAGWYLWQRGPTIEFMGGIYGQLHLLDGRMVRRYKERQIECRVDLELKWFEMVPEEERVGW